MQEIVITEEMKEILINNNLGSREINDLPLLKAAVEKFITINGHEPTSMDFDNTKYLPSSRTIQRRYKGLPNFRTLIGLSVTDFTKGATRSLKAKKATDDCLEEETILFVDLLKKYGEDKVSSPTRIFASRGYTADFRIIKGKTTYLVDIFKPNSTESFKSCIRIKNKKYLLQEQSYYTDPVKFLYVCVNEEVMVPMKNEIPIMSLREFREKFLC